MHLQDHLQALETVMLSAKMPEVLEEVAFPHFQNENLLFKGKRHNGERGENRLISDQRETSK